MTSKHEVLVEFATLAWMFGMGAWTEVVTGIRGEDLNEKQVMEEFVDSLTEQFKNQVTQALRSIK